MKLEHVTFILEEKYSQLARTLIAQLRDGPAPFGATFWPAFLREAQRALPEYEPHEARALELMRQALTPLSHTERQLLWLLSGGYAAWQREHLQEFPMPEEILQDIADELFSRVEQRAIEADLDER